MTGGERKRVLVFGDQAAAATIARRMEGEYPMQFEYVGFFDENARNGRPSEGEGLSPDGFDGTSSHAPPLLGLVERTGAEVVYCVAPLR
ncbi:MAG TPA: hypothetical protein VLF14_12230, partial [Candidatus Binatia bacterium]|nr:hypothetical protein [Candidatus Binatia bacterium]